MESKVNKNSELELEGIKLELNVVGSDTCTKLVLWRTNTASL